MGCGATKGAHVTDSVKPNGTLPENPAKKPVVRGDLGQQFEARQERERIIKERQERISSAALEYSGKYLEEHDRLSLHISSKTASRRTSRTGSPPLSNRKQVQFKVENNSIREVNHAQGAKNKSPLVLDATPMAVH